MGQTVYYKGEAVGEVEVVHERTKTSFRVRCTGKLPEEPLRCFGCAETDDGRPPLLIGLPIPQNGERILERTLSDETRKQAGWADMLPDRYYLAIRPEKTASEKPVETVETAGTVHAAPLFTGDRLLDNAIKSGMVTCERTENGLYLSCPFDKQKPFPLAFAALLCSVSEERAVLRWQNTI